MPVYNKKHKFQEHRAAIEQSTHREEQRKEETPWVIKRCFIFKDGEFLHSLKANSYIYNKSIP